ncbi:predicted permease, major facilitator superfamily [Thermococcus kodakarensis KOD1]|uniref:Predicted permease, major facilitator superfamily n=1 Tax=Thermococcus kodakarensis (strain ATCC BAA-918 / JCM 12380 / KOD1) TaxID=69014 RepID=Q5JDI5_THEKO|nr:MFS transporter [Thermococcus kodakarensis]WCN27498.1 MFS transporter [Thermococcus kodakarensis]WCN29788.1 MFS transporter [Thermococcus kodakarensis]BAD85736.1 predicted permease, major facilitator superfamily [Thermococcus kodakarensis KOD1]
MERRRLAGIVLLVLSAFTGTLAFRLATPAIAFYTRDTLSASMLAVSIVSMSFVLARAFSSVFGGLLLEKRKSILHIGGIAMMGNALAVHLYPLTSNWIQVAGIKLLNGFLNGLSWPMAQFVVAVAAPQEIRARVTAVYFFFGSIASLLGNYVYAYTIDLGLSGQMWVSSVFFVLTGLIMIIAYILLNDWVAPKREKKSSQRPSLDPRKVLVIASLMAVIVAFTSGEITYVYVSEALGLEKATTATLLGWVGFFASLLSYFSSWFADKVSEVGMVKLTAVLAGISPILAAVKTSFTVFLGIFLALFGFQSFRPISRKVLASYHRSSLAIGGVNGVQNLSTFIGGVFFGLVYSIGEIHIGVTLNGALLAFTPVSLALLIQAVKLKGGRE